ncbi:Hsp33 family molecular chaperone HslO [Aerococcus urinae]|uniref:Hsp33 family molecular chaperone HslO n=1 Tax=Aerococcus urinae TaxID=1376 RepID=UPI00254EE2D8|nr:Hsp33 family molecular chaperone HslO [Aerococcus urinae]MDK6474190.1 Hsp33 family molecular chaperone HslO [Aerococcus urinae]
MTDKLIKAISKDGFVRCSVIDAGDLVEDAHQRHDTWSAATAALGRTLIGTLLLAGDIKDDARMSVQIKGNGLGGKIVTTANGAGEVKGYIDNPHVSLDLNDQGKLDVRKVVGTEGTFSVTKDLGLKEPFSGQTPIVSGEIAEDFTYYLAASEQIPSAIGLGVLVNPDESVNKAGGWMLQVLPGASEETISRLERTVQDLPHITKLLSQHASLEEIIERLLGEGQANILSTHPISFTCDCTKERFAKCLVSLGSQELKAIIEEDGQAETVCHFCNSHYHYSKDDLEKLLEEAEA